MKRKSFVGFAGTVCVVAAMLAVEPLAATTQVLWADTDLLTVGAWGDPASWTDSAGAAIAVAPTNAADSFATFFPALTFEQVNKVWYGCKVKTITTGGLEETGNDTRLAEGSVNPVIDSIGADESWKTHRYQIQMAVGSKQYCIQPERLFSVRDPNDFLGLWTVGDAKCTYELRAEAGFTPVMHALDTKNGPLVRVPSAGTEAAVEGLRAAGTLFKTGQGTLEVIGGSSSDANYVVREGTLRLDGGGTNDEAIVERLLSEALMHLDASVATTIVTSNDDGYAWVTRWSDVRGNGVYAYPDSYTSADAKLYPFSRPAFMSPAKSPTDRSLVDFGARLSSQQAELGPLYCHLILSHTFSNVREAAYAVQTPKGPASCTVLGASSSTYDWVSDGTGGIFFSVGYEANNGAKVPKGRFTINGAPTLIGEFSSLPDSTLTNVLVMHAAPIGDTRVNALATDRHSVERSGGSRLGEVLLFSRELTMQERAALDRYLVERWVTGPRHAATGVDLAEGTAIDVPEGHAPRVGQVSTAAADSTIVKTGAGTLELDCASAPSAPKLDIRAGGVRFVDVSVPTNAPAGGAYIWLDASETNTFTYSSIDGKDLPYVSAWKDCRPGVTTSATAQYFNEGNLPFTVENDVRGLATVNLGTGGNNASGTQCYFSLPGWPSASANTYAGFVVVKFHAENSNAQPFGCHTLAFLRSAGMLVVPNYTQRATASAFWSVNGRQVDPFVKSSDLAQNTSYVVLAFRSSQPLVLDAIGKDRSGSSYTYICGNVNIGEFITYRRELSFDEFRQTEAYLMAKWLGKEHPANIAKVGELSFAAGADAVIDTDRDLSVDKVSGGSGRIVKKGAGSATVEGIRLGIDNPEVVVEEGSLTIGSSSNLVNEALFHFDASDIDSLTYYVEDGITNVTAAADVRGNGLVARSAYDGYNAGVVPSNYAVSDPVLDMVETKPGVWRPAFDFGDRNAKDVGRQKASAFYFQRDGASMYFTNVRETFVVARQKEGDRYVFVNILGSGFGLTSQASGALDYYRGAAELVYDGGLGYPGFANNGSVRIDGVDGAGFTATLSYDDGFRLLEFIPGGNTRVGGLALDRTSTVGGSWICEAIGFSRELTTEERAYLRNLMRAKWFEDASWPSSTGPITVTVGAGGAFVLRGSDRAVVAFGDCPRRHAGRSLCACDFRGRLCRTRHLQVERVGLDTQRIFVQA